MSIEIRGSGGGMRLPNSLWEDVLGIASRHGWRSAGTVLEHRDDGDWPGYYVSNDCQTITEWDCENLCVALRRALCFRSKEWWQGQRVTQDAVHKVLRCIRTGPVTLV
ncbi:MAG: hypothetical protein R3A47_06430 [Polyangiales bacterium]